jgi:hypothetical protein
VNKIKCSTTLSRLHTSLFQPNSLQGHLGNPSAFRHPAAIGINLSIYLVESPCPVCLLGIFFLHFFNILNGYKSGSQKRGKDIDEKEEKWCDKKEDGLQNKDAKETKLDRERNWEIKRQMRQAKRQRDREKRKEGLLNYETQMENGKYVFKREIKKRERGYVCMRVRLKLWMVLIVKWRLTTLRRNKGQKIHNEKRKHVVSANFFSPFLSTHVFNSRKIYF